MADNVVVPIGERATGMKYAEAYDILSNADRYTVSMLPAVKPKGGQMFLISTGGDETKRKDWMCDQYTWKVNDGTKRFPESKKSQPFIAKYYHKIDKTGKFQRHGWWLLDNPHLVLVHYIGDETTYIPKPHGNTKHSQRHYVVQSS